MNPSAGDALTMSDVTAKALERDVAVIPVQAEAFDRGDFDMGRPPVARGLVGAVPAPELLASP